MAIVIKPSEARKLDLPGRDSREIVSALTGAASVTLRLVAVPVSKPGKPPRGFHNHDGFEECIYVLSGKGVTHTESAEHPLTAGDTIIISPGEMHFTQNTGSEPLVLLCFFPVADITNKTQE